MGRGMREGRREEEMGREMGGRAYVHA